MSDLRVELAVFISLLAAQPAPVPAPLSKRNPLAKLRRLPKLTGSQPSTRAM
jgi:hypothetical protein